MSFQESGVLESSELADKVYMRTTVAAVIGLVVISPLYGMFSDRADPKKIIPTSFLVRSFIGMSFRWIKNPNTWAGYFCSVSLVMVSVVQFISVEVYFMQRIKKTVRGTLMGFAMFAGCIGTTSFALFGGKIFDQIGPWAPFMLLALLDGLIVIISLAFIFSGLLDHDGDEKKKDQQ